jgi:pimeloyl-ACP methyl ester carboxylesterase
VEVRDEQRRARLARVRRSRRIRRALIAAVAVALVAALTAAIVARGDGHLHRGSVRFDRCSVQLVKADCAVVRVPEDPARPHGRTIGLRVAVIPATRHPPAGALFFLAGGPGDAASDSVPAADQLFGKLAATHDIVLVDQRGTGGSQRLSCGPGVVPATDAAAVAAYARRCFQRLGPQARLTTTAVAADDLDAVRRTLGYGRIDLYGVSYGGTAAQVYLALHPASVRTVVLDSTSLLGVPLYAASAANAERALRAQLADCTAQTACHHAFPHPREDLARLLAHPPGLVHTPAGPVVLSAAAVAATVRALSLAPDGVPQIPSLLHAAVHGAPSSLAQEFARRVGTGLDARARLAMSFEILCSEPWAAPSDVPVSVSYLSASERARARLFQRVCRGVPRGVAPARAFAPSPATAPVLMLAGGLDPQDPPGNLRGWRTHFPAGRLIVVPQATHGVIAYGCTPLIVARFVDAGTARGLDTRCLQRIAAPRFESG